MYGDKIARPGRSDVIAEVTTASSYVKHLPRNLVLRVGRLIEGDIDWQNTGTIIMTPAEAEQFMNEVSVALEGEVITPFVPPVSVEDTMV